MIGFIDAILMSSLRARTRHGFQPGIKHERARSISYPYAFTSDMLDPLTPDTLRLLDLASKT